MISVRRITPDDGPLLRSVRLVAIADNPGVYATTLEQAEGQPLEQWKRVAAAGSAGTDQSTWFAQVEPDGPAGEDPAGAEASPEGTEPDNGDAHDGGLGVAGMVNAYRTSDNLVTLTSLWSAPGYRGIGVADALVERVTQWALVSGGVALRLWVVERNEFARRFYEGLGFEPTGRSMTYEPDPRLIECEMRKQLT